MSDQPGSEPSLRWLLLIHQIPPKPDYFRVKVRRRLHRLGAVALKNSVYVLPNTEAALEDFQWLAREIVDDGGDARVCEVAFFPAGNDEELRQLFHAARDADYQEIAEAARAAMHSTELDRAATDIGRLKRRLADVVELDYFGAPMRREAEDLLAEAERTLGSRLERPEMLTSGRVDESGRTWVTRRGVFIDRIASAWLIRRFIDPDARFQFVDPNGYRPRPGEIRFDMFDAEYTHEGERCTFETLLARFGLRDRALRAIGEIVHDIDCKDERFGRDEAAGVATVIAGIARAHEEDAARIERGGLVFDDIYSSFERRRG